MMPFVIIIILVVFFVVVVRGTSWTEKKRTFLTVRKQKKDYSSDNFCCMRKIKK